MLCLTDRIENSVQEGPGDHDRRKKADHYAQGQRQGEAFNDAGAEGVAEPVQDRTCD